MLRGHFPQLLGRILLTPLTCESDPEALRALNPRWEATSPGKAAFEALIRNSASAAWAFLPLVLPVFVNQVQPPGRPAEGSAEAHMQAYQAQRGEQGGPDSVARAVDVRLALLALLEGLLRAAAGDWQSGASLSSAALSIVKQVVVPNLVWRVGRVEATVRKVALAMAHGLLKAGALGPEQLGQVAVELVPLIVSNLDDMESTPRQIACLCLTVLFERLRGFGFGDSAVREIYPKLVARLDDSNDAVRKSVCGTLQMFLQCAHKSCFAGTVIDYVLEQLFVHLDDPDPDIQQAVYAVIVVAAHAVDKALVLKKAESSKDSHRSSALCNRLIVEVQGFEILDENSS
jgi:dynein assembly factor 5